MTVVRGPENVSCLVTEKAVSDPGFSAVSSDIHRELVDSTTLGSFGDDRRQLCDHAVKTGSDSIIFNVDKIVKTLC